jgi:hypothetical protein
MKRDRLLGGVVVVTVVGLAQGASASPSERADEKQLCASAAEEAEQLRSDARLRAARERLLRCSRPECPAAVRSDCAQWMTEIEAAMPTVVLGVRDASGQDVLGARVSVDGVAVTHGLDGKALEVDPGVHKFRFESGGAAVEQAVLIREGEKSRAITAMLDVGPVAPAERSSARPAAGSSPASSTTSSPHPSAWTWALGGIGLVALGLGAYLELSVNADASGLQSSCGHFCSHAQVDPLVLKQQVLGPIAFGVGALSLGLAAYTFFAAPVAGGAVSGVGVRF